MEFWDIYDADKKPTGRTMKRNDWCLKDGEYHLTVLGVVARPDKTFLCLLYTSGVGSSITLMFQAFVCARIGMDYCRTDRDKMIAGVMAAVLATQGTAWASAWALAVGFGLNIFLSNWDPRKKEENAIEDKN